MHFWAATISCFVAAGVFAAVPDIAADAARVFTLECEDVQRMTEPGGPDDVLPAVSVQQDWFRARLILRRLRAEVREPARYEVALVGFEHESIRDGARSAQRWPNEPAPPESIAAAERSSRSGKWRVSLRPGVATRIPAAIDESFLAHTLNALVDPQGTDRRSGSPIVTRTGRWRRVGDVEFRASIKQVWTIGTASEKGLVPYGWRGEMTILDPAAPIGAAPAGRGTASELGTFDPVEGMYQDLAQSWDVDFSSVGARIAWRHRCSTSVAMETLAPRTGDPR